MGTYTTKIYVPNSLGTHTIKVEAINGDRDRGFIDQEVSIPSEDSVTIMDDDTTKPTLNIIDFPPVIKDNLKTFQIIIHSEDTSGVDKVQASLNGISYNPFYISPYGYYYFQIDNPKEPNFYTIHLNAWDGDKDRTGDQEYNTNTIQFLVVDDDDTPPSVEYMNNWQIYDSDEYLEIKILATEDHSGIGSVYADFAEIRYLGTYDSSDGYYHIFIPNPRTPETYSLDIWVWNDDYDGWDGDTESCYDTFQTFIVVDDDTTFPDFDLIKGSMGDSGANILFPFRIEATDESGISSIHVEIAGLIFKGSDWHYLVLPPGTYTMFVWVTDGDNDRIDDSQTSYQEFTIQLLKLDIEEWLTDSDFNPIKHFDFIFRKYKPSGYKLVATNPGQFYYHIEVMNTWPNQIEILTITAILPPEFILKGAMPIHVYLDGLDITKSCIIDPETNEITLFNINSGSLVYITIHIDFGLKGEHFESRDDFILESYHFDTLATGEGALIGTFGSYSSLIGHQKKTRGICGFITDLNGNPKANIEILLYLGDKYITSAFTDENGFYYFIEVDENTNYKVLIGIHEKPIMIIDVVTVKDDFVEANFYYQDI